jgi:hypothetical protein
MSVAAGSQRGSMSAAQQQPAPGSSSAQQPSQAAGAWSLLGKMYGSQMLAYMVAIHDAKAIMDRMRHMKPGM